MNRIVKDALILTAITIISGFILGAVYEITKEPIAAANEKAQNDAYAAVFENAASFTDDAEFNQETANTLLSDNGYADDTIDSVVGAYDEAGTLLGYVINVTTSAGYGGDIQLSVGIQLDGTLNGYEVLSINETAGLGMKAKEKAFKSQFAGVNQSSFEVTKGDAASDAEIEAISGATITSKAVTYAVDASLVYFQSMVGGAANE